MKTVFGKANLFSLKGRINKFEKKDIEIASSMERNIEIEE